MNSNNTNGIGKGTVRFAEDTILVATNRSVLPPPPLTNVFVPSSSSFPHRKDEDGNGSGQSPRNSTVNSNTNTSTTTLSPLPSTTASGLSTTPTYSQVSITIQYIIVYPLRTREWSGLKWKWK